MKNIMIASALMVTMVLSLGTAHAKSKHKSAAKMSREEAKELCLTTKGADLSKKALKKCMTKAMRTGKV